MALLKKVDTQFGVEAEYHRITLTNISWLERKAHIEIVVYANKKARDDGKQFLDGKAIDISGEQFDYTCDDNIVAKTYDKLKLLPEFEGAVDC